MIMALHPLFIYPDLKKNISSGLQQRIFIDSLDSQNIAPIVLCDKGNVETTGLNHIYSINSIPVRFAQLVLITLFPNKAFAHDVDNLKLSQFISEGRRILEREDISYIHTCSLPCLSHHVGLELKRKSGKLWVAQFYDPWYGNPERQFFTEFFDRRDEMKEAEIANNADVIIHSNPAIYNMWIERYGIGIAKKMELLPLGVPENRIKKAEQKKKKVACRDQNVLVISHIGSLSQIRPINTFVEAVCQLFKAHPNMRDRIKIQFVGYVSRENKSIISKAGLDTCTVYIKHQPASELEKFYDKTDILLLMDANVTPNIYFPSKLPDYLSQKLPVLCVTSKDSISYHYLHKANHACFEYGDINGILKYLELAVTDFSHVTSFDEDCYKNFAPEIINKKYQDIIMKHITQNK